MQATAGTGYLKRGIESPAAVWGQELVNGFTEGRYLPFWVIWVI